MKRKVVKVPDPLAWRYAGSICNSQGCWYIYENTSTGHIMNVWVPRGGGGAPALAT